MSPTTPRPTAPGERYGRARSSAEIRQAANKWVCWRDANHPTRLHPVFGWPICAECGAAPSYPERFAFISGSLRLPVVVPTQESPLRNIVAGGSAVIASPHDNAEELADEALVHYEGFIYGSADDRGPRERWDAAMQHAAGRLVVNYPTTAKAVVPISSLVRVGWYLPVGNILIVEDADVVDEWLSAPCKITAP